MRASEHKELTMTCRDNHMINVEDAIYGNEEGKKQCANDQTTKLGERFDLFSQIIYKNIWQGVTQNKCVQYGLQMTSLEKIPVLV